MRYIEDKRYYSITKINRSIIDINNELGIAVKTRSETKAKNLSVVDDIT